MEAIQREKNVGLLEAAWIAPLLRHLQSVQDRGRFLYVPSFRGMMILV